MLSWWLDESLTFGPNGVIKNTQPLFINVRGGGEARPKACTEVHNLFVAGDYVRTHTDVATMESANEAARRAFRAILARFPSASRRPPPRLFSHDRDIGAAPSARLPNRRCPVPLTRAARTRWRRSLLGRGRHCSAHW